MCEKRGKIEQELRKEILWRWMGKGWSWEYWLKN
jgi:hypothetical protein